MTHVKRAAQGSDSSSWQHCGQHWQQQDKMQLTPVNRTHVWQLALKDSTRRAVHHLNADDRAAAREHAVVDQVLPVKVEGAAAVGAVLAQRALRLEAAGGAAGSGGRVQGGTGGVLTLQLPAACAGRCKELGTLSCLPQLHKAAVQAAWLLQPANRHRRLHSRAAVPAAAPSSQQARRGAGTDSYTTQLLIDTLLKHTANQTNSRAVVAEHELQLHHLNGHVPVVRRRQRLQRLGRRAVEQLEVGARRERAQAHREPRHKLQQPVAHILLGCISFVW